MCACFRDGAGVDAHESGKRLINRSRDACGNECGNVAGRGLGVENHTEEMLLRRRKIRYDVDAGCGKGVVRVRPIQTILYLSYREGGI